MTKQTYEQVIEQIGENLIFVREDEWQDDEFRDPAQYYIFNALGEAVYFKTRNRIKAQEWADQLYGKGFYIVKKAIKAAVR